MINDKTLAERLPKGYDKERLSVNDMGSFYQVMYEGNFIGYITKETMDWKKDNAWKW